ncbi:MAG: LysR family transcriptional regulator [Actinomycetota bacterium]|nr:LysR family transcriptional regulator [Actinomycetota bacterium]
MARSEWLRTFVAVYRAGSVTAGARQRGLSQPAASQQLAALQQRAGGPLFTRTPAGVEATSRGRELYGRVADALDRLEGVLAALDGGSILEPAVVRVGASAEYAALRLVPALAGTAATVRLRFGDDSDLLGLLVSGELEVACLSRVPERRDLSVVPLPTEPFVLVSAPELAPSARVAADPLRLGAWLAGRPWVAVTVELPRTRRLWSEVLGRPFAGDLRLVAPDRRVVSAAVAAGMGTSLLPRYACEVALATGAVVPLGTVGDRVPPEPWFASTRAPRSETVATVVDAVRARAGAAPRPRAGPGHGTGGGDAADGRAEQRSGATWPTSTRW